jgi:hypothetical protein
MLSLVFFDGSMDRTSAAKKWYSNTVETFRTKLMTKKPATLAPIIRFVTWCFSVSCCIIGAFFCQVTAARLSASDLDLNQSLTFNIVTYNVCVFTGVFNWIMSVVLYFSRPLSKERAPSVWYFVCCFSNLSITIATYYSNFMGDVSKIVMVQLGLFVCSVFIFSLLSQLKSRFQSFSEKQIDDHFLSISKLSLTVIPPSIFLFGA